MEHTDATSVSRGYCQAPFTATLFALLLLSVDGCARQKPDTPNSSAGNPPNEQLAQSPFEVSTGTDQNGSPFIDITSMVNGPISLKELVVNNRADAVGCRFKPGYYGNATIIGADRFAKNVDQGSTERDSYSIPAIPWAHMGDKLTITPSDCGELVHLTIDTGAIISDVDLTHASSGG